MKNLTTIIINTLIFLIVSILIIIALEEFAPDGVLLAKECVELAPYIAKENDLTFDIRQGYKSIASDEVKLRFLPAVRVTYRKALSKIGLGQYGSENGISLKLTSKNVQEYIVIKGFYTGDHVIGIEIDYKNISSQRLGDMKKKIDKVFYSYGYDVIWTEL